jgi:hypothetical protein
VLKTEKGYVLPLILVVFSIFAILLVGLIPFSHALFKSTISYENRISARLVAEAGAKLALRDITTYLSNTALDPSNCSGTINAAINPANTALGSYQVNYVPVRFSSTPVSDPPDLIRVTATGIIKSVQSGANVDYLISTAAQQAINRTSLSDVTSLVNEANQRYSTNIYSTRYQNDGIGKSNLSESQLQYIQWQLHDDPPYISPPPGSDQNGAENRILFENKFTSNNFSLNYVFDFTKPIGNSSGGVGVFYGVGQNDNARDMSAYVARFNYANGSFAVAKFTRNDESKITKFPSQSAYDYYGNSISNFATNDHDANSSGYDQKNTVYSFQPNGAGVGSSNTTSHGNVTDINIQSDAQKTDPFGNPVGRSSIPLDNVISVMNQYYDNLRNAKQKYDSGQQLSTQEQIYFQKYKKYFEKTERTIPNTFNITNKTGESVQFLVTVESEQIADPNFVVRQGKLLSIDAVNGTTKWDTRQSEIKTLTMPELISQNIGLFRQKVMIDGKELLNFIDFSSFYIVDNKTKIRSASTEQYFDYDNSSLAINSFINTRSGLRVKNVVPSLMKFHNASNLSYGQMAYTTDTKKILWKK